MSTTSGDPSTNPSPAPAGSVPKPGSRSHPTKSEAFRFWLKLGFISFGGPTGQIAIMHTELVEKRRWISHQRFLHALNYCMVLPGPEAQQLATYLGWLLHRTWGGITAGVLFVLPSALLLWGLSVIYVCFGNLKWIASIFYGLKPAVLAIVLCAVIRLGGKALANGLMWSLAGMAFVAICFFKVPFPVIIVSAGLIGLLAGAMGRRKVSDEGDDSEEQLRAGGAEDRDFALPSAQPTWHRAIRVGALCIALWGSPILLASLWLGQDHTLVREGLFFSKAAMVTFGGAYAVLPYVSQQAVAQYGWLDAGQMLDGLGLAETTPGPLIMVVQFVGFLGAYHHPGAFSPLVGATLGAMMTTWTTFVPCFLWIFLGAPHIEQLRGKERLSTALAAVTAAVVGVVLNLAVWFGWHVLFPAEQPWDWFASALSVAAFAGLYWRKWNIVLVVVAGGAIGLVWKLIIG